MAVAMAAPFIPKWHAKINIGSNIIFRHTPITKPIVDSFALPSAPQLGSA